MIINEGKMASTPKKPQKVRLDYNKNMSMMISSGWQQRKGLHQIS